VTTGQRDGLALLEAEDRHVLDLLAKIDRSRGQSVESRDRYGVLVKALIRALGLREAAALEVLEGLQRGEILEPVAEKLREGLFERRRAMDTVERMGRGVSGMELRRGQDFDRELGELRAIITGQIEWELREAIPAIRAAVPAGQRERLFKSARYLRRHAPTSLDPRRPRWRERAPVVSRAISIVTRLRDYPTEARRVR
jgi:hypothetical protein